MAVTGSNSLSLGRDDMALTTTRPKDGDRMIVLKEPYSSLVMNGVKKQELRCHKIKRNYFLADSTSHMVLAFIKFGQSQELDQKGYEASRHLHRCTKLKKPYTKTVATEIREIVPLSNPVPYACKRGAVGYARYYTHNNDVIINMDD